MMEEIHQEAFVSGAVSQVTGACLFCKQYVILFLHVSASPVWGTAVKFRKPAGASACMEKRQYC